MELISTVTVGAGGAATISFPTVPNTYDDLMIVVSGRSSRSAAADNGLIGFNGTTSNFGQVFLLGYGNGGTEAGSVARLFGTITGNTAASNTFSSQNIYIANYRASASKTFSSTTVSEDNSTTGYMGITTHLWNDTAAISSIQLSCANGNFVQGSSASLYGIRDFTGDSAPKAIGGSVTQASGYWIHTFTSSGTFTPLENLSNVEYLVVAGGGGGGKGLNSAANNSTGGGGAGGYRSSVVGELSGGNSSAEARLSLTANTNYSVLVGAGGRGGASQNTAGANGSNSAFHTITALGGGGGAPGESGTKNGSAGGSGGGSAGSGGTGGAGTSGQGFAGATSSGSFVGAGGGGAAEAGNTDGLRTGGDGLASSITGTSVFRAGGGGSGTYANTGGAGGDGGGGVGSTDAGNAGSGVANTGGGGGGLGCDAGGGTGTPGNGGSGIVIVRYAV